MTIEAGVFYSSIFGGLKCDFDVITTKRVAIFELDIVRVEMPAIARILVMLNDYFTIEIVHNSMPTTGVVELRSSKHFFHFIDTVHQQVNFILLYQVKRDQCFHSYIRNNKCQAKSDNKELKYLGIQVFLQ